MKKLSQVILLPCVVWLWACPSPTAPAPPGPSAAAPQAPAPVPASKGQVLVVVTQPSQLAANVGRLVTLRGVVSNTKIPTLVGVDVASDAPDLRGKAAEAVGILRRKVVTRVQLDRRIRRTGMFAHRGAGTFYRLVSAETNQIAQVRPPPPGPAKP